MVVAGDSVLDETLTDFGSTTSIPVIIGLEVLLHFYQCAATTQNRSASCDYDTAVAQPPADMASGSLASINDDGTMIFDVSSSQSGKFIAVAMINEQAMDCNGSFVTFFPGPTDADSSTLRMGHQEHNMFVAGEPAEVFVESRDEFGNLREQDGDTIVAMLQVDCGGQTDCTEDVIPLNMTHGNDDGIYQIRFMTEQSGGYLLTVWLNGHMLGSQGHALQVGPSEMDLDATTVDGTGWSTAEAGAYSNFLIQTRDRFMNPLTSARVFEAWNCQIPCKSSTADVCDQFCTAQHGGLFDMEVKLLSRLNPERESNVEEETMCADAIRYVADGQFEAVYTCTISGVYSIRVWDGLQDDAQTSLNGTTRVKATGADASMSVIHDLDRFDSDAGESSQLKIQLVDVFGNERFEGLAGQDFQVEFQIDNPLPEFWAERPDLDPRSVQIIDDDTGVIQVVYTLYPAVTYTAHVTIQGEHVAGNFTQTVKTKATCTGTADEVLQSCTGNALFVPQDCSGTATDGFTNCTDNYLRFPSGNCTLGLGAGCTYTAAHTPDCEASFANLSAVAELDCPAGCTFQAAYTPQCEGAFAASTGVLDYECPTGCLYRVARSPFQLTRLAGRAPRLVAAHLDTSLFRISAEFDMPTNVGRANEAGSCAALVTPALLARFGSGSSCIWETPSVLVVTLGSDTTILDRMNEEPDCTGIATTTTAIAAACTGPGAVDCATFRATGCGAVGLVQCGDACIPKASIADSCSVAFETAADTTSGSCPTGCTYSQAIPASTPTCDLDASTDGLSECPPGCIRPSVIGNFRILSSGAIYSEFENSEVCASSIDIELPVQTQPPVAVIIGPQVVSACDPVLLSSASHGGGAAALQHRWRVWASACTGPDATASCDFADTLSASTPGLTSILNSSELSVDIDKGNLAGEYRYVAELQVTNVLGLSASAEWDFIVVNGSIPTLLVPHTVQVTDVGLPLSIEVAPRMDATCIPDGGITRFHWQQLPSEEGPSVELLQPDVKDLALAPNVLESSIEYHFQLFSWYSTAPDVGGMPVGVVHIYAIELSNQTSTEVSLGADPTIVIESSQPVDYVNSADPLVLRATIEDGSDLDLKWYAIQGTVNLSDTAATTTGREQHNLVLSPSTLLAGQHYRFRLYVTSASQPRYGEISLRVNQPPARGSFLVEPAMGYALSTQFELITKKSGIADWIDDPDDMPIQVRFSYFRDGEEFALTRLATVPNRVLQLPPGDQTADGWTEPLQVAAYPTDQYLAETKVTRDVMVQSPVNAIGHAGGFGAGVSLEGVVETYMDQIETAASLGDSLQVVYMVTLAAQQLNAGDGQRRRLEGGLAQQRQSLRIRMFELGAATTEFLPSDQHGRRSSLSMLYSIMQNPCELSYDVARRGLLWAEIDMAGLYDFTQEDLVRIARIASFAAQAASDTECSGTNLAVDELPVELCQNATYRCEEGRCYVETFDQMNMRCVPDGVTQCSSGTCTRTLCEPGLCNPGSSDCSEGRCVTRSDGSRTCFEGQCPLEEQSHHGEFCNITAEELEAARRTSAQKSMCMSLNMNAIVRESVGRFAARQIAGEATVQVTTDAFILYASMQLQQVNGVSDFSMTGDSIARNNWRILSDLDCVGTTGAAAVGWGELLLSPSLDNEVNETKPLSFVLTGAEECGVADAAVAIVPPWSALPQCLMPCYDNLPSDLPSQLTCNYLEQLTIALTGSGGRCSVDLGTVAWLTDYVSPGTVLADICPVTCGVCPPQAHHVTKVEADACSVRAEVEGSLDISCHTFNFAATEWDAEQCIGSYNASAGQFICSCTSLPDGPVIVRSKWKPPPSANATVEVDVERPAQEQLSHREMKKGFVIPLVTCIVLWALFLLSYTTALLTDARARHQIYMTNAMKNTFSVPVLPRRTGECHAYAREISAFVKRHHLLCSTKLDGLRAHRMLIFACLLFTTCAASAAVLVLPAFLRRSAWHVLVRLGSALDAFVDPSTTGVAVEQVARRAVLTIVLVSPVELAARAVIGRLRHTERQASRARLGLGGRVWTAPPPADDVVLATKVQARFRRFLVQVQQRKQHQAQTMAALESMDKQRVRLEWATSGVGDSHTMSTQGLVRYRAAVKLILHSGPHPSSPQSGTLTAGTEFEVLEMQTGKARSGEHMTRWFCIQEESDGSLRHGWVRETSADGTPLCVPVESSTPVASVAEPDRTEDADIAADASSSSGVDHLSRLQGISSFYKGLKQQGHHDPSGADASVAARKWAALLPPLSKDGSAAVAKWKQRIQAPVQETDHGPEHAIAKLDFVREKFGADASRRAVEALLEGAGTLLTPEKLVELVVRMQARVRGALERRRLQKERALALSYPYSESTGGRGEARKGGRSSRFAVCTSSVGACTWCALCSYFVLTVTVDMDTEPALEWLACCGFVCAAQALVLWPLVLVVASTAAQCFRCCTIDRTVRALFRAMDRDHTAAVDHAEFTAMIDLLGKEAGADPGTLMTEDEINTAFRLMDVDLDGSVTLKEFSHWWALTPEERADFQIEPASWSALSVGELRRARKDRLNKVRAKHAAVRQRAKNVEARRAKLIGTGMSAERAAELAEAEEKPVAIEL